MTGRSKVDMLPGTKLTPRVLLEKCIERLPTVRHLMIIEEDLDGTVHVYTTEITRGDLAWMRDQFEKITR